MDSQDMDVGSNPIKTLEDLKGARKELEKLGEETYLALEKINSLKKKDEVLDKVELHLGHPLPKYLSVFFDVAAITIGKNIFVRSPYPKDDLITHELIPVDQQQQTGFIKFLVLYVGYWLKGLWKTRSPFYAYKMIPFEQEAYYNQHDKTYYFTRGKDWWKRYL